MSPAVKKRRSHDAPWMSVRAAAIALAIQPPTVMTHAMAGRLEYQKTVDGRLVISRESVERLKRDLARAS